MDGWKNYFFDKCIVFEGMLYEVFNLMGREGICVCLINIYVFDMFL